MSVSTERTLIRTRLIGNKDEWDLYFPGTNRQAPQPTEVRLGYIHVTYSTGALAAFQADNGGRQAGTASMFRHPGLLILSVMCRTGEGTKVGLAEAERWANVFRGGRDASGSTAISYKAPNIREVGFSGQFYQIDVEIPYDRDTQYSVSS